MVKAKDRTSWERALNDHFLPAEQQAINESAIEFAGRGNGRHIVASLQKERFLDPDDMQKVQSFLLGANWSDYDLMTETYQNLCFGMVLKGGRIRGRRPTTLGRAAEPLAFAKTVCEANGGTPRLRTLSLLLSRLASGSPSRIDQDALIRLRMAKYASWVTWDQTTTGAAAPFSFSATLCADEIRGSLGLSSVGFGRPIYLMTFPSEEGPKPIRRPTCADAGLQLRFEPPPVGHNAYGLTKPWEEVPGRAAPPNFNSRPEGLLEGPMRFPASVGIVRRASQMTRRSP